MLNSVLLMVYIALFAVYPFIPPERIPANVQLFLAVAVAHSLLGAWLLALIQRQTEQPTRLRFFKHFLFSPHSRWFWLALILLPRVAVAPMLPWLSDDVFRYLWDGNVLAHGINPYLYVPSSPALASLHHHGMGAGLYAMLDYKTYATVYPPLAQATFALTVWIGGLLSDSWLGALFVWKILVLSAELCGLWCVWKVLCRLQSRPQIAPSALAYYACVPLPVLELAGQAHVDALLLAPLGALLLLLTQVYIQTQTSRVAALLGVWTAFLGGIKILPVALALPLVRWLPSWRLRGVFALSVVAVCAAVFMPLLGDAQARAMFLREARLTSLAFQFNGGLYYALCYVLGWCGVQEFWQFSPVLMSWLRLVATLGTGIFARVQPQYSQQDSQQDSQQKKLTLLWNALLVSLVAVLLVSSKVHTWYFVPPLLVNILVRRVWLLVLASGSLLSYSYYATEPFAERYGLEMGVWAASALVLAVEFGILRMRRTESPSLHS
jgi:hypothetical protein